jgi:pyruvate dehydrogenase E1 component alpha subunit
VTQYPKKKLLYIYKKMLSIRLFEESLIEPIMQGEVKTPCHLYSGEEAIAVGICSNLNKEDVLFSNHRSHGHYLAKGGSLEKLLAEIFGKKTGCSKGRGGSMHVIDNEKGMLGSVPIVAGTISLTLGAAMKFKIKKQKRVAVSFFGGGSTAEGVVYESLNFAALKNLPIIFACENNLYATHMPINECLANTNIYKMAEHFMPSYRVDGNDILKVLEVSRKLIEDSKKNKGPAFIEFLTYRQKGHVGPDDNIQGEHTDIRSDKEVKDWLEKDPIKRFEKYLITENILNKREKEKAYNDVKTEIKKAYEFMKKSPYPSEKDLFKHVYEK